MNKLVLLWMKTEVINNRSRGGIGSGVRIFSRIRRFSIFSWLQYQDFVRKLDRIRNRSL